MQETIKVPSWGVLGNPSKEKIREYSNMPVGQFKAMVKNMSRKSKGKTYSMYKVYVEKRVAHSTVGELEVAATSQTDALANAQVNRDEVKWEESPSRTDYTTYHYSSYDPRKMWDYNRGKSNEI